MNKDTNRNRNSVPNPNQNPNRRPNPNRAPSPNRPPRRDEKVGYFSNEQKQTLKLVGVLSVGVAYTLQVVAQKKADPTFAAILLSTESVFSAIGGAIFGSDNISWIGYLGCGLIFAGVVVSQLPKRKRTPKE